MEVERTMLQTGLCTTCVLSISGWFFINTETNRKVYIMASLWSS